MTIFPDRIDGYAQIPMLNDNSRQSMAINALRSAVISIEKTIGNRILDSNFYKKFGSIRDRLLALERTSSSIRIPNFTNFEEFSILTKDDETGWREYRSTDNKNIGIVIGNEIVVSGLIIIESNDNNSNIIENILKLKNNIFVQLHHNDSHYFIMIKNTW